MHSPAAAITHFKSKGGFKVGGLAFVALELWLWFDMADLDYQKGSFFPFCTAGWFFIGQLFVVPIFGVAAWVISDLYKRWPRVIAILASVGLGTLLGTAFHAALPRQQLSRLIGANLAKHGEIERMKVSDTFNDGNQSEGTLLIDAEFVKTLQAGLAFELVKSHPNDRSYSRQPGTIYQSRRVELRISQDEKRCFFQSRYVTLAPATRRP